MRHLITTVLLGPLLLVQGVLARRRALKLPEPPGEREGVTGTGPRLRLLVTGDSAAAGVGASHQSEALLGQTVSRLSRTHRVEWSLVARTGARTASTITRLHQLDPRRVDVVVTSLGVNDVTSGLGMAEWQRQQSALRALLRERFSATLLIVSGLPPVGGFPALPQPLRWYLGQRADQFDRDLRSAVAAEPDARFLSLRFTEDMNLMARDGFHPGPGVYAEWGERVADMVARCWNG